MLKSEKEDRDQKEKMDKYLARLAVAGQITTGPSSLFSKKKRGKMARIVWVILFFSWVLFLYITYMVAK